MSPKDQSATNDLTPLSPAIFHILLSLGEGERHGYAIKREISAINSRLDSLEVSIQRIHTDIGTLAVAVDEHTRRLDLIEKHLGMDKARN